MSTFEAGTLNVHMHVPRTDRLTPYMYEGSTPMLYVPLMTRICTSVLNLQRHPAMVVVRECL